MRVGTLLPLRYLVLLTITNTITTNIVFHNIIIILRITGSTTATTTTSNLFASVLILQIAVSVEVVVRITRRMALAAAGQTSGFLATS
jgi:hypothetical protein